MSGVVLTVSCVIMILSSFMIILSRKLTLSWVVNVLIEMPELYSLRSDYYEKITLCTNLHSVTYVDTHHQKIISTCLTVRINKEFGTVVAQHAIVRDTYMGNEVVFQVREMSGNVVIGQELWKG